MKINKKICYGCDEEKAIWKNFEGNKYCQYCWNSIKYKKDPPKPKVQKPIAPKSKKQRILDSAYTKLRRIYLTNNPTCQACLPGCSGEATDIHHTYAGANRSEYFLSVSTWLGVCRGCHDWIHANPKEARSMGLLK